MANPKRRTERKLFVSHASTNEGLVHALRDLLELGVGLPHGCVFCTSSGSLPPGVDFAEAIRQNLSESDCVIVVLSEEYVASYFCLCELGGTWVQAKHLVPILVPPLGYDSLVAVLQGRQALRINDQSDLDQMRDYLAEMFGTSSSTADWNNRRDQFLRDLESLLAKQIPGPTTRLREVFGYVGGRALVVLPTWVGAAQDPPVLHWKDVFAISYLLELHREAGLQWDLLPHCRVNYDGQLDKCDMALIGGPISNALTGHFLQKFCPGLSIVDNRTDKTLGPERWVPDDSYHLAIGGRKPYTIDVTSDVAVLVKVSSDRHGEPWAIHMVFGLTGTGTAAAAYYLKSQYERLHGSFGNRSYCIVVPFNRNLGHRNLPAEFEDVTDWAFGQPVSGS